MHEHCFSISTITGVHIFRRHGNISYCSHGNAIKTPFHSVLMDNEERRVMKEERKEKVMKDESWTKLIKISLINKLIDVVYITKRNISNILHDILKLIFAH